MIPKVGMLVNAAVIAVCLGAALIAVLWRHRPQTGAGAPIVARTAARTRVLALATLLLVVSIVPLVHGLVGASQVGRGTPGALDLAGAWNWGMLIVAGMGAAGAVLLSARQDGLVPDEPTQLPALHHAGGPVSAGLATGLDERRRRGLAHHEALLQTVVVAKMALELDEPDRAAEALDQVVTSTRSLITLIVENPGMDVLDAVDAADPAPSHCLADGSCVLERRAG